MRKDDLRNDDTIDKLLAKQEVYGLTRDEYYAIRGYPENKGPTKMEARFRRYHNVYTLDDGWLGHYQKNWR